MSNMFIKEKYRLFLSWDNALYKNYKTAILTNVKLTGPVVKEIEKVASNDGISLDLSFQYVEAMGSWSIAKLSWDQVLSQTTEEVLLGDCILVSPELTKANLLSKLDKLLIDTENHESEKHSYHLVYPTVMINKEGNPYSYEKVK